MTIEAREQSANIALLDPLRALCAVAVVAWHLSDHLPFQLPVFSSAAFAVDLFMNISGFLMAYHYYDRERKEPWEKCDTVVRFYLRRFFRIAPLFYVLTFVIFFWYEPGNWWWLFYRLTFLFGFIPDQATRCLLPDWSIALEMQFYAVFPFLMLLVRKIGFGPFFFLCSCAGALSFQMVSYYAATPPGWLGNYPQPTLLPLKLQVFAVGMVAAGVLAKGPGVVRSLWFAAALPFYAMTCQFNYTILLGTAYAILLLICLVQPAFLRFSVFVTRLNNWTGRRRWLCRPADLTYSGYLVHNIVLVLCIERLIALTGIQGETWPGFLGLFTVIIALVALLSSALFKLIEHPGIRLGKRCVRLFPANTPSPHIESSGFPPRHSPVESPPADRH